jgi:hypothetical protein
MDYLESRGIGMERMVEGYQRGQAGNDRGAYRDYIKVSRKARTDEVVTDRVRCFVGYHQNDQAKIAQHDVLHPAPFVHALAAATPTRESLPLVNTLSDASSLTSRARAKTGRHPLQDRYKRDHGYLRISLTERCNLRCEFRGRLPAVLPSRCVSISDEPM